MLGLFQLFLAAIAPPSIKPEHVEAKPGGGHRLVTVREGYRLVELPPGQGERPTRTHTFDDVPSFSAWLLRNAKPETTEVFASQPAGETGGSVVAISGATWERDTVRCRLALDPSFARLLQVLGKPGSQDAMLNVLRALGPRTGESGKAMIRGLSALTIKSDSTFSRTVDERTGGFKAKLIQANAQHDVPLEIVYVGPVYLRGGDVRIVLSLLIDCENTSKPPIFSLQWPEKEVQMLDGYFAEVDALKGLLGEGWSVSLGSCAIEDFKPSVGFDQKAPTTRVEVPVPSPSDSYRR